MGKRKSREKSSTLSSASKLPCDDRGKKRREPRKLLRHEAITKTPFSKWKNKNFMLIYILSLILLRCYVCSSRMCVGTHFPQSCLMLSLLCSFSNTGFLCLVIYRRDTHVVELQIGNLTSRLEDACAPDQYDVSRTPFTTLLGTTGK